MRKLLFIFAMLLVAVTSAVAEESDPSEQFNTANDTEFQSEHFTISGQAFDGWGLYITKGHTITIEANNGEIITKVKYKYGDGTQFAGRESVSSGNIETNGFETGANFDTTISDVNATSLTITSDVDEDNEGYFEICQIVVYYKKQEQEKKKTKPFVMDDFVQTETFITNNGWSYQGTKIQIEGAISNANGLLIQPNDKITITSNTGVEIGKVDLCFSSNDNQIESTSGIIEGDGANWSVNNIYSVDSPSLEISNTGSGPVQVSSIKVYYLEMSEEKTVSFNKFGVSDDPKCGFTLTAGLNDPNKGISIAKRKIVKIESNDGVEISKVDLKFNDYKSYIPGSTVVSQPGVVEGSDKNWSINDVYSSNLTFWHNRNGKDDIMWVDNITVHYRTKISTIDVTANLANDAYWTTFYSEAGNYQAPDGTHVFKVNLTGTSITMTEIEDGIVNKGEGVVLKSETTGEITMSMVAGKSKDDYSDNNLVGTSVDITNPGNAYVLYYKPASGVGFYKLTSNGTIAKNKAYLIYNQPDNARAFFAFDGETTGIEDNIVVGNEEDDKVYDLQGRRVAKPVNGLYIVNGKKVIMNKR